MRFLKSWKGKVLMQAVLLLCGVLLLTIGVMRGEAETILMKAIYVCLECIGIG